VAVPLDTLPTPSTARHLLYGIIIGVSLSLSSTSLALFYRSRKRDRVADQFDPRPIELRSDEILSGVNRLNRYITPLLYNHISSSILRGFCVGNTPLVRINSLSDALGVEILGKAEVCLFGRVDEMNSQVCLQFLNPGGSVKDRVALRSEFQESSCHRPN